MNLQQSKTVPSMSNAQGQPVRLSVNLRHGQSASKADGTGHASQKPVVTKPKISGTNESFSEESTLHGNNVQQWFDRSNKHPKVAFSQCLEDEAPYFLPRNGSNASNDMLESRRRDQDAERGGYPDLPVSLDSGTDEYRSVIDDLTIENKRLKEKLKKYQNPYTPHLEKERLFEVKVHGLSTRGRRELEETLREFATRLEEFSSPGKHRREPARSNPAAQPGQKHTASPSLANIQFVDSAYASMSNSGLTSTRNLTPSVPHGVSEYQTRQGNDQNIQSFLHNIPGGLLPKHSPFMTDRQKKKLVVQRLEQLFTGKLGVLGDLHSQPLQQQEISRSAARADRDASTGQNSRIEGVREANMMDTDPRHGHIGLSSHDTKASSRDISDSSADISSDDDEREQRPTRPLDLDPDRAQVPSDNIEYIRHLGQSTPQMSSEDSADVESDAHGWTYLNLLVNMAQLHIINVTPDFVRSAVKDVSDRFQLSSDGNKIRWRGGSKGTQLSSDSGHSGANLSPDDSESFEDGGGKRRKVDVSRFASIPVNVERPRHTGASRTLQYKPLFNHRSSSCGESESSDGSDSGSGYKTGVNTRNVSSALQNTLSARSQSDSQGGKRRDDGPMVFYSGAKFCTDLSGDHDIAPTVGFEDEFRNRSRNPLGSSSERPPFPRTTSGSTLPFRPFRDQKELLRNRYLRSTTPELLTGDEGDFELIIHDSIDCPSQWAAFQTFDASGLGGTQPADHFAVQVSTHRTKAPRRSTPKLSKFSAPGSKAKRFHHSIPSSVLNTFIEPHTQSTEEAIAARLATLATAPSPSPRSSLISHEELPVQTHVLSTKIIHLSPSQLPAPSGFYSMSTITSEEDSSDYQTGTSSGVSISHLHRQPGFQNKGRSFSETSDPDVLPERGVLFDDMKEEGMSSDAQDNEIGEDASVEDTSVEDESEDDESIDMLAHERQRDPEGVGRREKDFEMED